VLVGARIDRPDTAVLTDHSAKPPEAMAFLVSVAVVEVGHVVVDVFERVVTVAVGVPSCDGIGMGVLVMLIVVAVFVIVLDGCVAVCVRVARAER